METEPKRPISVWIAQILSVIYGLLFTSMAWVTISDALDLEGPNAEYGASLAVMNTTFAILFLTAFLSMVFRWKWGRWFSTTAFLIVTGWLLYGFFTDPESPPLPSEAIYLIALLAPLSLFLGPLIVLAFAFILNPRVRYFFSGSLPQPQHTDPPPPPTFDT
jgi:hypothetical protein